MPSCDTRALGEQRCDDCNTFMRAIGIGGQCPECLFPIAITELTERVFPLAPDTNEKTQSPRLSLDTQ